MRTFGFLCREQKTAHKLTENLWVRIKKWAVPILTTAVVNREVSWWGDHFTSELISTTALTLSRLRNSQCMFYQTVIFNCFCYDYLLHRKKKRNFTQQDGATYLLKSKSRSWVSDLLFLAFFFHFHRMTWIVKDLRYYLISSPPAAGKDNFHYTRLLRAPSNMTLNTWDISVQR